MNNTVRTPAVANMFYPGNAVELRRMIKGFLQAIDNTIYDQLPKKQMNNAPKAMIVPHAGYIYSGPIAASAYALLHRVQQTIKRVVLLGPSHRVAFHGLSASSADTFVTPLGDIPVDRVAIEDILVLPQVSILDQAHLQEHSLEVQLPFLQEVLKDFKLVPLVVGEATPEEVGEVLDKLWGGSETLIVISSDLSHYHDYETACQVDKLTSQAIEEFRVQDIRYEQACGRNPINGLLQIARDKGMKVHTIDLRNSGDTAGSKQRVVGYGAYIFQ